MSTGARAGRVLAALVALVFYGVKYDVGGAASSYVLYLVLPIWLLAFMVASWLALPGPAGSRDWTSLGLLAVVALHVALETAFRGHFFTGRDPATTPAAEWRRLTNESSAFWRAGSLASLVAFAIRARTREFRGASRASRLFSVAAVCAGVLGWPLAAPAVAALDAPGGLAGTAAYAAMVASFVLLGASLGGPRTAVGPLVRRWCWAAASIVVVWVIATSNGVVPSTLDGVSDRFRTRVWALYDTSELGFRFLGLCSLWVGLALWSRTLERRDS